MIFASDLDRTLIYSEKFLEGISTPVKAVENGKYCSYMTERAVGLLKNISQNMVFVPCTTRTIEQYQRIQFFQKDVKPKFAVVSNGANIFVDGVLDLGHQKLITEQLRGCMAPEDILKEFDKISTSEWANPMRHADGVFHYCIIERAKLPLQELNAFGKWALRQNWEMSIQGTKLYLVPKVINKWRSLERIMDLAEDKRVLAAGDSLLDLPLIKGAEYAISPAHGELYEKYRLDSDTWNFTGLSGILAGEAILDNITDQYYKRRGQTVFI